MPSSSCIFSGANETRAGIHLTNEGMALLPQARELCAQCESFCAKVDELTDLRSGLIRIGTFSSVATHWLPRIIRAFQANYPNIDYELLLGAV